VLASELGAAMDEIPGETVMPYAANLVEWAERNNKLYDMTVKVVHHRPDAKWD
jgi:hypothetical protein